ncbi:phospholipase D-like domain-containing protein [Parvularcula oceani]|uniref:phospholipase D-like domain-containing protein n=1 Tax=Parvularcula oceani TaxID=1247963 RepID=UPI00068C50C7|nr:phospholipase D-like domain-containing protein [Parvularcula oceani]
MSETEEVHGASRFVRDGVKDRSEALRIGLETVVGTPFVGGNAIDTLCNGDEIFPAMLEAIRGAQSRVEFLTFVYWQGDVAEAFVEAFIERVNAGVEVFVMLDGFGGRLIDGTLVKKMEEAGIEVRWFRPLATWKVWRTDNRTHRKLLIVDGDLGFTGGVGIAEEWEGDARNPKEWRDNHYRITGPAVQALRAAFFENWVDSAQTISGLTGCLVDPKSGDGLRVQTVISSASVGWSAVARLHEALILMAEKRVRIATPYFAPREAQTDRLVEALGRGVQVQVIMPGPHIDKRVSELASAEAIDALLRAGAELYRYQPTMFHHKLVSVDGLLASIGSANFNMRSAFKDDELALNVLDEGFTAEADAIFDEDLKNCLPLDPRRWRRRSAMRRAREIASRIVRHEV